ncbi:SusC/RagA family TonB-linked outer membrane protein [Flavobacterium sedimenticola]|uniref:SusC/RagA family TonB-linked outer membrane protein n=1 Tax=Flavobacterium sedimenticola TaxID=3043286 RepID=A0ABT6XSH6_9FLAO|nr:SusC/RagA family TonB-linked outer membrane protein [Flavobacterium sedimenticola]MDI9258055.1 SusC/RagA family TonB-linked outer membrane protein [Flavobacterium sedimenticola]
MKTKLNGFLTLFIALLVQISFAQERVVNGVVKDGSGLPIPGVNVLVKGTNTGTQTDFDGKYSIKASSTQVLVFTFIGMKTQEVVASTTQLNVTLKDDAVELEGVVVTAMGIKREKKALGYAAATIGSEQITSVTTNNPLESLSGKIAGVDISAPNQPGASSKVIVRGFGTITGSNQPLYVVDGTPINSNFSGSTSTTRSYDGGTAINDLDPNSIDKITFLKGAAATALYGSRAGRGVIIITTKKGKNQSKINVDYTTTIELSEVARVPHLQNRFGQGWNGLGYSQLASGPGPSNENGSWGPAFNGEIRPWGTVYNNSQQIKPYSVLEDNYKDFFEMGTMYNNSVNVSGGSDFSDFSFGFTNTQNDGVIPTNADSFQKRALTFNGGLKNEKSAIRLSLNYTNREQYAVNTGQGDEAGEGATMIQELLQIPRDVSIVDLQDYTNNPFNNPSYYFTPYASNPYFVINENSTKLTSHNFFGNVNLFKKLNNEFSATWQIGGNVRTENVKSYGAIVNYLPNSAQDEAGTIPVAGGVTEGSSTNTEFDTYFNLNYDKKFSDKLRLTSLIGVNFNQREVNSLFASVTGLDVPNYYELSNSPNRIEVAQGNSIRRTFGLYAQAELSYIEKVFLTLSARRDVTSTLPVKNQTYYYPAASLSTILLDNGTHYFKLRTAWSEVANDTGPYQTESSLVSGSAAANFGVITAPFGGVNYYELDALLGNSELKPERKTEWEVGFESSFFKKRVNLEFSYYINKIKDLIASAPIDPSTGYTRQTANIGDLQNRGIEIVLGITPVKTDNFTWDLNWTFSKNQNEMTKVMGGDKLALASAYGISFFAEVGQPLGAYYGRAPLKNDAGQYVVNPDTGYYVVSEDLQYLGNSQRDFVMGLQNSIKYKNVTLNFAFDWKQGGKMYSYTKRLSGFVGNGIETTYNDRNPFIIPNSVIDNGDGTYSENTTPISFENITNFWGNTTNNPGIEKDHLIDKTFIRLRDISLYYNLKDSFVKKLGLTKFSLGVYGRNLFMWTPADNPYIDPEVTTYGNDLLSEFGEFGANPSQRSYGAIMKLSF